MKTKIALLCLGLATSGFAVDEYLPLDAGKAEIDVGLNPVFPDGGDMTLGVPLQFKYGIMQGLDVEVAANYVATGNATGLLQPEIALKYAIGTSGVAPYLNVVLPFATGDYDAPGTGLGIAPGVVVGRTYDKFLAVAKASYLINFESDDFKRGNVLDVYLKPGYQVDPKLAGYVGVGYRMYGEAELAGTAVGGDGTGFSIAPGVTYMLSDKLAVEANLPIVLSDDVNGESWGIWASLYISL